MKNKEIIDVEKVYESLKMVPIYDPITDKITYISEESHRKILASIHKMVERTKKQIFKNMK